MKTKSARTFKDSSRKKKLFMPIFLASIMIFSVFAIIFSGLGTEQTDLSTETYKGHTFKNQGNGWLVSLEDRNILLRYNPLTVESSLTDIDLKPIYALFGSQKVYLTTFPGEKVKTPLGELYLNMKQAIPQLFLACLEEGEGCNDLPLKTCTDAGNGVSLLILREGEVGEDPILISPTKDCYILTGEERDLILLMDKLILNSLGAA